MIFPTGLRGPNSTPRALPIIAVDTTRFRTSPIAYSIVHPNPNHDVDHDDHHADEMDDNETDGVSSSAKRLFDWVSDPSNNGSVYRSDVPTYIIREVLSLLSEEDGIFEEEEGEEEWDSSHLSVRPGIQPAIASYQLLLGVLGPSVEGGDDMTERVALRGAIISRVDFLAQAMAAVDMSLGDMYSSWHKVCVLPELEGCESADEYESGDESDSASRSNKRQKTSNVKKMEALKKDNEALKKDNKELTKDKKKMKKDNDKVDAKNIALARDTVDSRSTKVKDVQILKDAQKRAITKLKNDQKDAIMAVKKDKDAEKETALSTQKKSKSCVIVHIVPSEYFN